VYNESEIADKEWRLILGIKRCLIITHRQDLACCEMSGRGKSRCEGSDARRGGISCYQLNDFLLKIDCPSGGGLLLLLLLLVIRAKALVALQPLGLLYTLFF
jgi:hypothetical protein